MIISNYDQILENASTHKMRNLRHDAMHILAAAVEAVDPYKTVTSKVKFRDGCISFGDFELDLKSVSNVYVVGGGKAGEGMAKAVEEILGDRITDGVVNVLKGKKDAYRLKKIRFNESSHPIPGSDGARGVEEMFSLMAEVDEDDLVIVLLSGGGSSLMTFPAEPLKLDEIKKLTKHLLFSGATINEINAVRKHTSAVKGGLMAEKAFPATTISLILSDVVGDPLDTIASGPTAPDKSTFHDAVNVLKNRKIWDKASGTIRRRLEMGVKGLIPETPKPGDKIFQKVTNIVVGSNITAARAALKKAQSFNYQSIIISTRIEGEARQVGAMFSSIAHEISSTENPVSKPGAVIAGGETTVVVAGSGTGGRNQEQALSAAARIEGLDALIATLATDGIDGPTEAAGAVVDGSTMRKASSMNLNIREFLKKNDSYTFFRIIGDGIITGPTGTNVNDLTIILVSN